MKLSQGFENYYTADVLLLNLKSIYRNKKTLMALWNDILKCMMDMKYKRNGADTCMYLKWTKAKIIIWKTWIEDCMAWRIDEIVNKESKAFNDRFDFNYVGEVKEHVGCKIIRDDEERNFNFKQPVLIQSFKDEYDLSQKNPKNLAVASAILAQSHPNDKFDSERHTYFKSGGTTLIYISRYSRPEIKNSVQELTSQGSAPVKTHCKDICRAMGYSGETLSRRWTRNP